MQHNSTTVRPHEETSVTSNTFEYDVLIWVSSCGLTEELFYAIFAFPRLKNSKRGLKQSLE